MPSGTGGVFFSSRFNFSIQVFSVCFYTLLRNFCHKNHIAVNAVQAHHIAESAFFHKTGGGIAAAGGGVLGQHAQADAVQVQRVMEAAYRSNDNKCVVDL